MLEGRRLALPLAALACIVAALLVPASAGAACAERQPAPAPAATGDAPASGEALGRAAGDDPVVTEPSDPTCDGAGYDAEFPDVELATDPTETTGGGAVPTPTPTYTGTLPVTGIAGSVPQLALLGILLVNGGVLVLIASQRREGDAR